MSSHKIVFILEDDPDDRLITTDSFRELGLDLSCTFFEYSTDLYRQLEDGAIPHLILVDYNSMPENAIQILQRLKGTEKYRAVPVVVLGDSADPKYIEECYQMGANSFVIKPSSHKETLLKIDAFFRYWLYIAESAVGRQPVSAGS